MRGIGKLTGFSLLLLLAIPAVALPQWRDYRGDSRQSAYRAGYDDGYRDGIRQGRYDAGIHRRENNHLRGNNFESGVRYRGEYRKGFKEGFKAGYDNGYRNYFRNPRDRWFPRYRSY